MHYTKVPRCHGVLEACLYARELDVAARFYAEVIGLEEFARIEGRHVFFRTGANSVFLLFNPERTSEPTKPGEGTVVPTHGGSGPGHVAFSIDDADIPDWRGKLARVGVSIEAEVSWPRGGHSIYLRDPAGNSVELATQSLWGFGTGEGSVQ